MNQRLIIVLAVLAVVGGGLFYWRHHSHKNNANTEATNDTADDVTDRVVDLQSRVLTAETSVERLREFLAGAQGSQPGGEEQCCDDDKKGWGSVESRGYFVHNFSRFPSGSLSPDRRFGNNSVTLVGVNFVPRG